MDQERPTTGGSGTATDFRHMPVDQLLAIRENQLGEWLAQGDLPGWVRDNIVGYVDALAAKIDTAVEAGFSFSG